jgi:hypothetical protein
VGRGHVTYGRPDVAHNHRLDRATGNSREVKIEKHWLTGKSRKIWNSLPEGGRLKRHEKKGKEEEKRAKKWRAHTESRAYTALRAYGVRVTERLGKIRPLH